MTDSILTDPGSLSDAEFLALHRPMRFQNDERECGEYELLNDPSSHLIGGTPGSGKSHFLRWLELELTRQQRPWLRIPRGKTPADVPRPATTPTFTPEELQTRLCGALREEQRLAQERVAGAKQQGQSPNPVDRDTAGWLAQGLVDLFNDPITSEMFLKGILVRAGADLANTRFTEKDFLRPDGLRFLEAGRSAQSMLTKLNLASTAQYRAAAAALVNRALDTLVTPTPIVLLVEDERSLRGWTSAADQFFALVEDEATVPMGYPYWKIVDTTPAVVPTVVVEEQPPPLPIDPEIRARLVEIKSRFTTLVEQVTLFHRHELLKPRDVIRATAIETRVDALLNDEGALRQESASAYPFKHQERLLALWKKKIANAWNRRLNEWTVLDGDSSHREQFLPEDDPFRMSLARLQEWRGREPVAEEELVEVEQAAVEFSSLKADLPARLDDAEFRSFQAEAEAGGVPFDRLNDMILRRLREPGVSQNYRIFFTQTMNE